MTTRVSLSDTLPKDSGSAKFGAWVDISTSQNDFSLPAGIGSRTANSKIFSALQVGTHVAGSKLETPMVGVLMMGWYNNGPSAIALGGAMPLRADQKGAVYVTGLSATTCVSTGSTTTYTTASGVLYSALVAGCGLIAGAQLAVMNGATSLAHFVFSGANETLRPLNYALHGACFGSLKHELRGSVGAVYVTLQYGVDSQAS